MFKYIKFTSFDNDDGFCPWCGRPWHGPSFCG